MENSNHYQYLPSGKAKHYFYNPYGKVSACGTGVLWYASSSEQWQHDEKGLEERPTCRRCLKITMKIVK